MSRKPKRRKKTKQRRTRGRPSGSASRGASDREITLEDVLKTAFLQARDLADAPDLLASEVVASNLLAGWEGADLRGESDTIAFFGRAMIEYLERQGTSDALALLYGLHAVDRVTTVLDSRRAIRALEASGVRKPAWAGLDGTARFENAWAASDLFGDQDVLVGRFSYEDAAPHDVVVLVDHNMLHAAKDIAIVPADADVRDGWPQDGMVIDDLDAQEYVDRVSDALALHATMWGPAEDDDVHDLQPLMRGRLLLMPRARPIKRKRVSRAVRDRLYTQFRRSEPGRSLGRDTMLVRDFIDYAAEYNDDPLRWSPTVVELCLLDWFPRKVSLTDADVERLPEMLRAWVRFAGASRGLALESIDDMIDAVYDFEVPFRDAMADEAQFGPAKSLAGKMLADGIDVSDTESIQSWIDGFNALPQDERVRLTGGPDRGGPDRSGPDID